MVLVALVELGSILSQGEVGRCETIDSEVTARSVKSELHLCLDVDGHGYICGKEHPCRRRRQESPVTKVREFGEEGERVQRRS